MLWQPIPPGIALVTSRAVAGLDWHVRASCQPRWAVGARSTSSWSGVLCHSQFICQNSRPPPPPPPPHPPLPPLPPPPLTSSPSSSTYYCIVCLIRVVAPLPLVSSLFIYLFIFAVSHEASLFCMVWPQLSMCTQIFSERWGNRAHGELYSKVCNAVCLSACVWRGSC